MTKTEPETPIESEVLIAAQSALIDLYNENSQNGTATQKQLWQLGVLLEAIGDTTRDPKSANAHSKAGYYMQEMGWLNEAREAYKRSIELDDTKFIPYIRIGEIYMALAEDPDYGEDFTQEAIKYYEYALHMTDGIEFEDDHIEEELEKVKDTLDDLYEALNLKPTETYDQHITEPAI